MKNVLMIALEFPPINTSGSWRPFYFAKHLPEFGFTPLVVTQNGFYYVSETYDTKILEELDPRCKISTIRPLRLLRRVETADPPARPAPQKAGHLGSLHRLPSRIVNRFFKGKTVGPLATLAGLNCLRRYGFDLIWATGPPWLAVDVGRRLSRLTGKPLVADIRDPWTYGILWDLVTPDRREKLKVWEQKVLQQASRIVYTSPLTTKIMQGCTPRAIADRMVTITNGFCEQSDEAAAEPSGQHCLFCYLGRLQKGIRDPSVLLQAFKLACSDKAFAETARLRIVGSAGGLDEEIDGEFKEQIENAGRVSYTDSLRLMREADVLILLQTIQGEGNDVIGGKLYEYMAARKPILGIVPEDGGDAWLLHSTGAGHITGISDVRRIADGFIHYWRLWKEQKLQTAVNSINLSGFNRRKLAGDLAHLFEEVLSKPSFVR